MWAQCVGTVAYAAPLRCAMPSDFPAKDATPLVRCTVHEPFMLLVRTAHGLGLDTGMDPVAHERQLEREGVPHIEATLAVLKKAIRALPVHCAPHLSLLDHVVQTQAALASALGPRASPPDYLGTERRGTMAAAPKPLTSPPCTQPGR